ncbi:MAG: damage-control phosphatase ARMT1 family protein [Caldilineaceae bacterium]
MKSNPATRFDPNQPPPPLMTSEPGSFAYHTMKTRLPAILETVLVEQQAVYPPRFVGRLRALQQELVEDRPIQPLVTSAPDGAQWVSAWTMHQGRTWLNVAWYFAEAFFYRRLIEAVEYFGAAPWSGLDPFGPIKQAELNGATAWPVLTAALAEAVDPSPASLRTLLHFSLWGNRVDLSYLQVAQATGRHIVVANEAANLLVDDTEQVVAHLQAGGRQRVDFICDNTGAELLTDLALADLLLRGQWAEQITLHVKMHPTYVSDTIVADLALTVAAMQAQTDAATVALAQRLITYRDAGKLLVRPDWFWNSSHFFWAMPATLQAELSQAHLVINKGDANYRRLLGDSRWPTTVPARAAIPYFPTALLALRTLKSDPIVGLQTGQAAALDLLDPAWRVNGKRGLIQAVLK